MISRSLGSRKVLYFMIETMEVMEVTFQNYDDEYTYEILLGKFRTLMQTI